MILYTILRKIALFALGANVCLAVASTGVDFGDAAYSSAQVIETDSKQRECSGARIYDDFRRALNRDQFFRAQQRENFADFGQKQTALDEWNQAFLAKYVAQCGWPRAVGRYYGEPIQIATAILLHAPGSFQDQYIALAKKSADSGETPPIEMAKVTDRHRLQKGLGQLFGTQRFIDANGLHLVQPIDDPQNLNERRKALNLGVVPGYP